MKYSPLDNNDFVRRLKRSIDGHISYRKLFIALVIFTVLFLYSGPKLFRWMFNSSAQSAKGGSSHSFIYS